MQITELICAGLIFCALIFVIVLFLKQEIVVEKFSEMFTNISKVDFYVITMGDKPRLDNIDKQLDKMNSNADNYSVNIQHIDAVVGKTLDLDQLVGEGNLSNVIFDMSNGTLFSATNIQNRKNEVGCYMSHLKIHDIISKKMAAETESNSEYKPGYSVIFEDDFDLTDGFLQNLDNALTTIVDGSIDFDMVMLGMYGNVGSKVKDTIHELKCLNIQDCYQTHAILINNASIDKIIDAMKHIDMIVDVKIFEMNRQGKLKVLRLENSIVYQANYGTSIRNN